MAISSLVAAESSTVNAKVFQISEAYKTYEINDTFQAGGYTVTTFPTNQQVDIEFVNASGVLIDTNTTSGTVSFTTASAATQVYLRDRSGATNTVITITYTSTNLTGATISGTLDTVTSTSTYNQTGLLYVLAIGGGGAGGSGAGDNNWYAAGGGGSGGFIGQLIMSNTPQTITIGSGGTCPAGNAQIGNSGGTTSFGNLLSATGGAGGYGGIGNPHGVSSIGGAGGSPGGAQGGNGAPNNGNANAGGGTSINLPSLVNGNNGAGGGGGAGARPAQAGGGSGIGTGGAGGNPGTNAAAGTGYGAGGGGGAITTNVTGGSGTQGVVYVLRGF